ncbi:hypothetical protein ACWZJV_23140 [Nocardioides sp. WG-D5]|uniref:hypothetical protein n=1 Tax=Nocardioides luteus TaxID=1844 RepID=UPI0002028340|nr:hypothetical protein [Nocardioides luteus]EGD43540.1 hypothetical protein NBCG_02096 [Nocardioidaceae bacterium Broad-1]MBG6097609.1 hypothetical protein [Nocardioides luteus]
MARPQLWRPRPQSWRTPLAACALVAVLGGVAAGCAEEAAEPAEPATGESTRSAEAAESELRVNGQLTCDQDVSSDEAKDTIERVGGLQQPTWSVRFAESTAAGVVVLVAGDLEDAQPRLFDDYHVAAIVGLAEDQTRAEDFKAVREAVREICG